MEKVSITFYDVFSRDKHDPEHISSIEKTIKQHTQNATPEHKVLLHQMLTVNSLVKPQLKWCASSNALPYRW